MKKEKSTVLETLFGSVLTAGITAASFTVCLIAALALGVPFAFYALYVIIAYIIAAAVYYTVRML